MLITYKMHYTVFYSSKEIRRQEIAEALSCEVSTAPPSRLLTIIGQAMKYQQLEAAGSTALDQAGAAAVDASSVDLFRDTRGSVGRKRDAEERAVKREMGSITFALESHPETLLFCPDGTSTLVTGSVDGFIEVWEVDSCKLRVDLEYQARDELMMHSNPAGGTCAVLCSTFSSDGELLATGSEDGQVKLWRLKTGVCLRKIPQAHTAGITSIAFNRDNSQVLTTSFDFLARVHGLKSGKILKELR